MPTHHYCSRRYFDREEKVQRLYVYATPHLDVILNPCISSLRYPISEGSVPRR